jgi:acylphosphatase
MLKVLFDLKIAAITVTITKTKYSNFSSNYIWMVLHYQIVVSGHVQGVGFRRAARDEARFLGLNGFVKNLSNGNVLIEVEGEREKLCQFIAWCRKGPAFSDIADLIVEEGITKNFSNFEIKF